MDKQISDQLKQLILNEMAFRTEFRAKRQELENLTTPITKHVRECCNFWVQHLSSAEEIIVMMDNGTSLKLTKPKVEECSVESYLPYGIDFEECKVIDISK